MHLMNTNTVDEQYLNILKEVLSFGDEKETRSGEVISKFGMTMRFNLQDGFPVLTTKKVFTRGAIHELLWFLNGDTNTKYLVENNVHIWDADAFRFYKELVNKSNSIYKEESNKIDIVPTIEEFNNKVISQEQLLLCVGINDHDNYIKKYYTYGDLGPIYGEQWRNFGGQVDQVRRAVTTLRCDPTNRRILISGYNPCVLKEIALPPCHTIYQFDTTPLTNAERVSYLLSNKEQCSEWKDANDSQLNELNVPKYKLNMMFMCRSQDLPLGTAINLVTGSLLLSMIAQVTNMIPNDVIWVGGDCHIYKNQISSVKEQLSRDPHKYQLPKLWLNPNVKEIDDFRFDDIKINNYESYPKIVFPLSVG